MIHHKTMHKIVMIIIIVSVLFCIGGLMTGWVSKDYKILRESPKIQSDIIDSLQKNQKAEVIVSLNNSNSNLKKIQEDIRKAVPEFKVKHEYKNFNAMAGEVNEEALMRLKDNPKVKKIYLDKILHITLDESVPLIKGDIVHNAEFKNNSLRGKYQSVCVLDTGVDYNHPALKGRVISGYDYVNNDSDAMDDESHGTHVAGIIASNDTTYTGVAPESKIIAVKVCDSNGDCEKSNILGGIDWCISNASKFNISVISMSLGDNGAYNSSTCPNDFDDKINTAVSHGIFIVASSGNNGHSNGISSPACSPNITSVGAIDNSKNIWAETNTGELLDLLAPGVDITSTVLNNKFDLKTGTSMAAPHVAGAAVLIYQHANLSGKSITPEKVREILKQTGTNITDSDNNLSFPLINIEKAVLFSDLEIGDLANPYPKTNASIVFYGNYTNRTNGLEINNGNCSIEFNDSIKSIMNYNSTSKRYEYIRNFTSPGFYKYNITCNQSNFETLKKEDLIEVVKGSENCSYPGSNIDWNLTGDDFSRCVGENLIINQSNINIQDNATFILKDTNLTLVGASTHYVINVSENSNFTIINSNIKGMDQSTRRLDIDLYGYGNIDNSTFENSALTIYGNKSHLIDSCLFKYWFTNTQNSSLTIDNSTFEEYVFFRLNSNNEIINSTFEKRFYLYNYVYVNIKNSNLSDLVFITDFSTLNFTEPVSNLTGEIIIINYPTISGYVDMPDTGLVASGNVTRYFPTYVFYTGTSIPYPNKQVNITDNSLNLIWQGTTDNNGYVNPYIIFNTTNYGDYNFTISTNESKDIFLLTDTPVALEAAGTPPGEDNGGESSGGGSSCLENWSCNNWSECINRIQNRTCIDLNNCGTIKDKPNETQSCDSYSSGHKKETKKISIHSSKDLEISEFNHHEKDKNCCLFGICWFVFLEICWYWWLFIAIILTASIYFYLKTKIKKKKKIEKALIKAVGIDWVLKRFNLDK